MSCVLLLPQTVDHTASSVVLRGESSLVATGMVSASVTEIWRHGLASLTALAETVETDDKNLRIQDLLRMATSMLLARAPNSMKSGDRAALIDNVAAGYLKFRLDPTLREDVAMVSCRVIRDALSIAVALEKPDTLSRTEHMKRLREAFPRLPADKDELVLLELILSYR